MTPETLAALQGSIKKWEAIVDGTGTDEGSGNCPLCHMFRRHWKVNGACEGCPVSLNTGRPRCFNSPYESYADISEYIDDNADGWDEAELDAARGKQLAAARAELEFLKSLLPDGYIK